MISLPSRPPSPHVCSHSLSPQDMSSLLALSSWLAGWVVMWRASAMLFSLSPPSHASHPSHPSPHFIFFFPNVALFFSVVRARCSAFEEKAHAKRVFFFALVPGLPSILRRIEHLHWRQGKVLALSFSSALTLCPAPYVFCVWIPMRHTEDFFAWEFWETLRTFLWLSPLFSSLTPLLFSFPLFFFFCVSRCVEISGTSLCFLCLKSVL